MSDTFYVELFKFLGIFTGAGFAVWGAVLAAKANRQAKATHILVNSELAEFKELMVKSSKAEGKLEGRAEAAAEEQAKAPTDPQAVVVVNLPHEPVPTVEGDAKNDG